MWLALHGGNPHFAHTALYWKDKAITGKKQRRWKSIAQCTESFFKQNVISSFGFPEMVPNSTSNGTNWSESQHLWTVNKAHTATINGLVETRLQLVVLLAPFQKLNIQLT